MSEIGSTQGVDNSHIRESFLARRLWAFVQELVRNWEEKKFDFANYKDRYREKVTRLLEAKQKGEDVVAPEEDEEPEVINLIDVLKRSVAEVGQTRRSRSKAKSSRGSNNRRRSVHNARRKRA